MWPLTETNMWTRIEAEKIRLQVTVCHSQFKEMLALCRRCEKRNVDVKSSFTHTEECHVSVHVRFTTATLIKCCHNYTEHGISGCHSMCVVLWLLCWELESAEFGNVCNCVWYYDVRLSLEGGVTTVTGTITVVSFGMHVSETVTITGRQSVVKPSVYILLYISIYPTVAFL